MAKTIRIRRAQTADAGEIARLSTELGYPASPEGIAERLLLLQARDNSFIAVAEDEKARILGWIALEQRLQLQSGPRAEIVALIVSENCRKAGIGGALVAAGERWASELGLTSLTVQSNVRRQESHNFYTKNCFLHKKTQHTYAKTIGS